ncbi:MAG: sulfatase [Candidatus Erginobacter occultus]|nr:sulfatase [Candidatus Erginobacter occultus]
MKIKYCPAAVLIMPAVLMGCLLLAGCGGEEARPNVIFILLDAVRADRFGCNGYGYNTTPNMDGLAAEGVTFLNHFSNRTHTIASVPSYFYSRYFINSLLPADIRFPVEDPDQLFRKLDPSAISLAGLFKRNGYHTVIFNSHPWLIPGQELVDDFDRYCPVFSSGSAYARAEEVLKRTVEWLEQTSPRPFFLYIHLMDTHFPHKRQEETLLYADKDYLFADKYDRNGFPRDMISLNRVQKVPADFTEADRIYLNALYDGNLRYTDTQVGLFVQALRENHLYDNTLIVISSDHGEYLGEHGLLQHDGLPWDAVTRIPLIMRLPGTIPSQLKSEMLSENVDLLPTLAGLLGLTVPPGKDFDGENLFQTETSSSPGREYVYTSDSIRSPSYKFIRDRRGGSNHLYHLGSDPGELKNLIDSDPATARSLEAALEEHLAGPRTRYEQSVSHGIPRFPFSIPADYFRLDGSEDIEEIHRDTLLLDDDETLQRARVGPVWIHNLMPWQYYLLGFNQAGLAPLEITFPLPDGKYEVSVACAPVGEIQGYPANVFRITLPQSVFGETIEVDGGSPPDDGIFRLGRIEVAGEEFSARIEPVPRPSWITVLYFGFEPLAEEGDRGFMNNQDRRERLQKLKALGYVQ